MADSESQESVGGNGPSIRYKVIPGGFLGIPPRPNLSRLGSLDDLTQDVDRELTHLSLLPRDFKPVSGFIRFRKLVVEAQKAGRPLTNETYRNYLGLATYNCAFVIGVCAAMYGICQLF